MNFYFCVYRCEFLLGGLSEGDGRGTSTRALFQTGISNRNQPQSIVSNRCLSDLILYIPANNFSVMSAPVFLG